MPAVPSSSICADLSISGRHPTLIKAINIPVEKYPTIIKDNFSFSNSSLEGPVNRKHTAVNRHPKKSVRRLFIFSIKSPRIKQVTRYPIAREPNTSPI